MKDGYSQGWKGLHLNAWERNLSAWPPTVFTYWLFKRSKKGCGGWVGADFWAAAHAGKQRRWVDRTSVSMDKGSAASERLSHGNKEQIVWKRGQELELGHMMRLLMICPMRAGDMAYLQAFTSWCPRCGRGVVNKSIKAKVRRWCKGKGGGSIEVIGRL